MSNQLTKKCSKCQRLLELSHFYKDNRTKSGLKPDCKDCRKDYDTKYHEKNGERLKELHRTWYLKNRENILEGRSKYYSENRKKILAKCRKYIDENKDKKRSYDLVHSAVESGRLVKQNCIVCGSSEVDAHHENYSKPLEVTWLCRSHHIRLHRGGYQNVSL